MRGPLPLVLFSLALACNAPPGGRAGGASSRGEGTSASVAAGESDDAAPLEPEACVARFEALKAAPGAPLALVDPNERASLFGRVRGAPSFFVREPRAAARPPHARPAHAPAARAERGRFARLRRQLRAHPRLLRAVALREGYVYTTDPAEALDLLASLRIADLFDEPELWLQRGAETARLVRAADARGEAAYRYAEGPREGHEAELLFLDRLATAPAELEVPLHRDVSAEADAWGFDRVRLAAISGLDGAAELRFGGRWVRAVLRADGPALRVTCLAEPADVRANVLAWRSSREGQRRSKRALFDAVTKQVDEALRFDRPDGAAADPDADGQLRAAWQAAFLRGQRTFYHQRRGYPVLSSRGEPWPPQVCVDFVLESFERASGTRFSVEGRPSRLVGRLDFDAFAMENRRGVLALEAFALEHPELFSVWHVPDPERTPFALRSRFFRYLLDHADDFSAGDVVAIQGLKRDNRVHQHAMLLEAVDPLTGFPHILADQMRRPRRRTWEGIMAEAPRRSLLFRLRPTELLWSALDGSAAPTGVAATRSADAPSGERAANAPAGERAADAPSGERAANAPPGERAAVPSSGTSPPTPPRRRAAPGPAGPGVRAQTVEHSSGATPQSAATPQPTHEAAPTNADGGSAHLDPGPAKRTKRKHGPKRARPPRPHERGETSPEGA
jgi:hypothetical protein